MLFEPIYIIPPSLNKEPASSRVTYFILQAYTGTVQEKSGEVLEKMLVKGLVPRRVEISKPDIPGSN